MSKIYKALEKAEKERGLTLDRELPSIQEVGAEKKTGPEFIPELITKEKKGTDHSSESSLQPDSMTAEQFKKLRTQVFHHQRATSLRTIMVTSATEGEGKTFIAIHLATGISRDLHAHALLVDCDLRNPSLAHRMGLPNGKGLSDYLLGNHNLPELIIKTEVDKLRLLSSGKVQQNPTELVGSRKMEAMVNELKLRYEDRYIIFDSTPLLATTEPEVLAKLVDGIILVVRAGITPREIIRQAIKTLDKEKIIGVVLNDVNFRTSGLYHRYYGGYGYNYNNGYAPSNGNHRSLLQRLFRK